VNKEFVAAFQKKHGKEPSNFSAYGYDAVLLIDSAVRSVKGELDDKDAVRAALRAGADTTRGKLRFTSNHFPVQDYYLTEVRRGSGAPTVQSIERIESGVQDSSVAACPMK
jgi:branched-chain amino acid transport system substrate-binding protein